MVDVITEILRHYQIFGLLNIFLLYTLLLAYSYKKLILWYSTFVLSITLDLFNYIGLFTLFNYSPNFTLAYLPWSVFTPIALFKFTTIYYNVQDDFSKKVFRYLTLFFCLVFCYFIIKSYWVLLGDLSIRDYYFHTNYKYPYIEYWVIKTIVIISQVSGLILSYSIIKKQTIKPSKDLYFLFSTLVIITLLSITNLIQDSYLGINQIISTPYNGFLTIIITCGLIISYRKIIGIDYKKATAKQTTTKNQDIGIERLKTIEKKILNSMEADELYKNRKLQLKDLSKAIMVSENYISETLAKQLQTNYYDFINSYRVNEVIKLMASEKHKDFKIMALAMESGFNSKTTFNTAFKKVTGSTPSQYRKTISLKK